MPLEPLAHLHGQPADSLKFTLTCPSCEGPLTVVNGTKRTFAHALREVFLVLKCTPCRRNYEVHMNLIQSELREPRMSGAEQRARRRERLMMDAR